MAYTYIRFFSALRAQNIPRSSLPHTGWFQPYSAYFALTGCFIMTFVGGYTVFLPGQWDTTTFVFSYFMCALFPVLFVGWKLVKGTRRVRAGRVDLNWGQAEIEEYQREYVEEVNP